MNVVVAILGFAMSGCATATFVSVGGDPKPAKTGNRALVNRCMKLPIYSGAPDRPYVVIGVIHSDAGSDNYMGAARAAVREADQHGAEGLILLDERLRRAGMMTTGTGLGLWNAYSRGAPGLVMCQDQGVSPLWRAYVSTLPAIYELEYVFAAIRWL